MDINFIVIKNIEGDDDKSKDFGQEKSQIYLVELGELTIADKALVYYRGAAL